MWALKELAHEIRFKDFSETAESDLFVRDFPKPETLFDGFRGLGAHPQTLTPEHVEAKKHVHPTGKQAMPGKSVDKSAWRVNGVMLGQPGLDEEFV